MAERSFVEEVKKLRLGAGETFRGEGILAVTKALLESGVAYVAGYQGAPISHLMDVLADAQDILAEHGIRFENSASEATAAANKRPSFTIGDALDNPQRDVSRIVLPPASFVHEQEKVRERWPAAVKFIEERRLNEFFAEDADDIGII